MQTVILPLSLYEFSDNFRNPLAGFLGLVEQLISDTPLSPKQLELIEGIKQSGLKLEALADKMLKARPIS